MIPTRESVVSVGALDRRLCRLACEVHETIHQLEAEYLTDVEAALLATPALHLTLALEELQQLIYEADDRLDDRPRLERLAAA